MQIVTHQLLIPGRGYIDCTPEAAEAERQRGGVVRELVDAREVEGLREALKPFAEAARHFAFSIAPDGVDDGFTIEASVCCRPERNALLSTTDFSRARAALTQDHTP